MCGCKNGTGGGMVVLLDALDGAASAARFDTIGSGLIGLGDSVPPELLADATSGVALGANIIVGDRLGPGLPTLTCMAAEPIVEALPGATFTGIRTDLGLLGE